MQRLSSLTDGTLIANIDEANGGYDYFGLIRHDGSWVIMRKTIATDTFLYKIGAENYSSNWTNRASLSYGLPVLS